MKLSNYLLIPLCLVLLFTTILTSCTKQQKSADTSQVMATVNGENLYSAEFLEKAKREARFSGTDYSLMEKKLELLDYLIDNELLFQQALKEGVARSPVIKGHIIRKYLQRAIPVSYKPSKSEIKEYYQQKKEELERLRASHILIKIDKNRSEKEALKKIKEIKNLLKNKKTTFASLARKYSEDQATKSRGGDLGFFFRGAMVKPFSDAAFALKVGELSKPVKTRFGYHLIKVTAEQRGLKKLELNIKSKISQAKRKEAYRELLEKLRSKATVHKHRQALAEISIASPAPKAKK